MELKLEKNIVKKDDLKEIYTSNKIELAGNYSIEKLFESLQNSPLVISAWKNKKCIAYCRVITDSVFFGRIQELIIHPDVIDKSEIVTHIISKLFESCPLLKTFHLNPGVFEKKIIYQHKHFSQNLKLRKLFWSIHEDEF